MDADLQPVVDLLLDRIPRLQAIYVFGSQSRSDRHAESDLDLAVLPTQPLEILERAEIAGELTARLANVFHHVDLIDLRTANAVLAIQVLETGRLLFQGDPRVVQAFELNVMTRYCDLNRERRDILADVARRGTILS